MVSYSFIVSFFMLYYTEMYKKSFSAKIIKRIVLKFAFGTVMQKQKIIRGDSFVPGIVGYCRDV